MMQELPCVTESHDSLLVRHAYTILVVPCDLHDLNSLVSVWIPDLQASGHTLCTA